MKSVRIWSFSGPYFPEYGPEKLRIRTLFMQCFISQAANRKKLYTEHSLIRLLEKWRDYLNKEDMIGVAFIMEKLMFHSIKLLFLSKMKYIKLYSYCLII